MNSLTSDSQIAAFIERQPITLNIEDDPNAPLVIFRGALELNRLQEEQLVNKCFQWKEDLEQQNGHNETRLDAPAETTARPDLDASSMKFIPQRELWDLVYNQRFDWRRTNWGGIYAEGQNIHIPLARRGVQQMISRAQNYFFQTSPWCSVDAIGLSDPSVASTANEWAQYRFHQAKLKGVLEKAVELAFIRGETVVKYEHIEKADYYQMYAVVGIGADGKPIIAEDGDFIFDTDEWSTPAPAAPAAVATDEAGNPVEAPTDPTAPIAPIAPVAAVLKRDGVTPKPEILVFQEMKIRRKLVQYSGPIATIRSYRDFLAPLNAPDLQSADCLLDMYDMPAIEIVEQYRKRLEERGEWDEQEYPRVMDLLRQAANGSNEGTTAANSSRPDLGENTGDVPMVRSDPVVNVGEFHLWVDADNDGTRENVIVLVDLTTKRPILYDYTANVIKGGKRNFSAVRVNPVDGRWHGVSSIDMLWPLQKFADLCVNRWDFSLSKAGSVTFFASELTREGQSNPNLKLNGSTVYHKTDVNIPGTKIVDRVPLYEFKGAQLERILQLIIQLVTNLTGTANVNDAAMAGLDTAKLATGVKNMQASGEEQFAPLLAHLTEGIDEIVESALMLAVQFMDESETFAVLGPRGAYIMKSLAAKDIRNLKWAITLQMTRYKAEQSMTQNQNVIVIMKDYYAQPPNLQVIMAPTYRNQIRLLGEKNVDETIRLPTPEDFANYQAQQMQAAAGMQTTKKPEGIAAPTTLQ